jgi:dUTP pyrophosphatase
MARGFKRISEEQFNIDMKQMGCLYEDIKLPRRATKKSSGYDFYSPLGFTLNPNETIKIPSGVKIYMLDNEELLLFPRSSVGFKYRVKIDNTIGKIDSDYYNNEDNEGHVWIKMTNEGNKTWVVETGDRIVQGTFYKYLIADNDCPISEDRVGGIGSSNK